MSKIPSPLTSPLLSAAGFRHAFFTRAGGVSVGPFATLNLSNSVGDVPTSVAENLVRAAKWLELDGSQLYWANQVHGCEVHVVGHDTPVDTLRTLSGDSLLASQGDLACCVRTADCVPILVADQERGCVAAIHAGWRGIVAGIVPQSLLRLCELGSIPENLIAAIGPHIRVGAFEVSNEVGQMIGSVTPNRAVIRYDRCERPHVALVESVREQLRGAGLGDAQIDDVGGCTYDEPDRFFSYRREGPATGRHLHGIMPRRTRTK